MGLYDRPYYQDNAGLDLKPSWDQRSAVTVLIIINVAVFIANALLGQPGQGYQGAINKALLLDSSDSGQPWFWWRTLSYAFVHDAQNIMHILFNMLSLYFLGRPVEQRYGKTEFLRIYLLTALFCGIAWLVRQALMDGEASVMGASGAVLCISMLFVFNYPTVTIYVYFIPMPAWVLGVFFVLSNFFTRSGDGIAYDVHLFGIAFATAYFFLGWNLSFLGSLGSLGQSWKRWARYLTGPRLKVHSGAVDREARDETEADRLLDKIHRSGKDSLTAREKKFLERYSQSVRDKKRLDS